MDLLNVLGLLIDEHPAQQQLLEDVLAGSLIGRADLHNAGVLPVADAARKPGPTTTGGQLTL